MDSESESFRHPVAVCLPSYVWGGLQQNCSCNTMNPNPKSRWSRRTGLQADIAEVDLYEDGDWSIACNRNQVGPGTIGWIARQGGDPNPSLGGFIVCADVQRSVEERGSNGSVSVEWYVDGRIHGAFGSW